MSLLDNHKNWERYINHEQYSELLHQDIDPKLAVSIEVTLQELPKYGILLPRPEIVRVDRYMVPLIPTNTFFTEKITLCFYKQELTTGELIWVIE